MAPTRRLAVRQDDVRILEFRDEPLQKSRVGPVVGLGDPDKSPEQSPRPFNHWRNVLPLFWSLTTMRIGRGALRSRADAPSPRSHPSTRCPER